MDGRKLLEFLYQLQIKGKFNFNTLQFGLQFHKSSKVLTSVASGAYFQKSIGLVNKDGIKDGMEPSKDNKLLRNDHGKSP